MKSDLDALMQANNLDAILITGSAKHNPAMYYLTGDVHLTNADVIKKRDAPPLLFHTSMERDEAAKTGLPTKNVGDYEPGELLKQCNGDYLQATILRYRKMLNDAGVTGGRMGLYGTADAGTTFAIFSGLQQAIPALTIVGEVNDSLLLQAMSTKSEDEIERIRRVGQITVAVVGQVADFLTSHKTNDGVLVKADGNPLTIGEVKSRLSLWLVERGAENREGVIFSLGRDAGVPHSTGNNADWLRLGQTIIFDIFPSELGGGYFYDFTRTWCLSYAPDDVWAAYEDVLAVYRQMLDELKPYTSCHEYQNRTCELFEARGHPSIKSDEQTLMGYTHSLGHGLGLHVHERPWFGKNATEKDRLVPGVVVTLEPGLYYPEKGFGVRLEDTLWIRPDGKPEVLAEYPLDLVLPIR